MDWRRINPWLRLRDMYADMDELERRIRAAERVADEKAGAYYNERTSQLRQENARLLAQLVEIASLTPSAPLFVRGGVINHIDGDLSNNDPSNIRIVNPFENRR